MCRGSVLMDLHFTLFKPTEHYAMVCEWWKAHKWPDMLTLEALPRTGIVIEAGTQPVAMGWLYETNSIFAWISWITVNPTAPRKLRSPAVEALLGVLAEVAKGLGHKTILVSTKNKGLLRRCEALGFVAAELGTTNMMKRV